MPITPILTADGSLTLHSDRYGETFHSVNGAVTESRHVFLDATGVADRLQARQPTRVLEIGFGLGLNCLLTADCACEHDSALDFHTIENDATVFSLLSNVSYRSQLKNRFLHDRLINGLAAAELSIPQSRSQAKTIRLDLCKNITVTLHIGDAISELPVGQFDAIYLDAFSPDTNPECWSMEFLVQLRERTSPDGVLTTYSAKGSVRRALLAAGYEVRKMRGPPGKREMLHALAKASAC